VVVDFSTPDSLGSFLPQAAARKQAVVIATTGHSEEHLALLQEYSQRIPIFRSANMSLGINLVKGLIKQAASVLGKGFDIEIVEMHHRLKKDAPSGTALLLLQGLNEVLEPHLEPVKGRDSKDRLRTATEVGIHAIRGGTIVGEHEVLFAGPDELIRVGHKAYSRQIFAQGAIKAATYIVSKKPGLYSMDNLIGEESVVTNLYVADNEVLVTIGNIPATMSVVTNIYRELSNEEVNIDMISQTLQPGGLTTLSFSLFKKDLAKAEKVIKNLVAEHPSVFHQLDADIAKITVEGPGMEQQSGVAYKFFASLEARQIMVKAVSTSETKISAIVSRAERENAVGLLKEAFEI